MTHRHRQGPISAAPVPPLDDDDILAEILLRLPPLPSSLPRAAAVCKRWRRLVSGPHFLRSFRAHHRKPPLLGFFRHYRGNIEFMPALDPPDCIPAGNFSLQIGERSIVLGCRHGRVLVLNHKEQHFLVWDPITGYQRHVAFPPAFNEKNVFVMNGAVVCSVGDKGHVHGACHSDPFQVVIVGWNIGRLLACIYSSETGISGNLISVLLPSDIVTILPDSINTLVGNSVCWVLMGRRAGILEFDLHRQNLAVLDVPVDAFDLNAFIRRECQFLITPADSGGLSFIVLTGFNVCVWKRMSNGDGTARWMLGKAIELRDILSLLPRVDTMSVKILGLDEDDNVMFKLTDNGVIFMVHLESMQFKKVSKKLPYSLCYPFASFYTAGMNINAGYDGVEILHKA